MEKNIKLHVEDLTVSFRTTQGMVRAVRGVTFDLHEGETLAVVGESGSGKSVSSRAIMGILAGNGIIDKGEIIYEDQDLTKISEDHYHDLRGNKIGMIFQDPMTSLNPVFSIQNQMIEVIQRHMHITEEQARQEALEMTNDKKREAALSLIDEGITRSYNKHEAIERAIKYLELVGIPEPEARIKQYPHEFSGGMRQRALIAMALSCEPKLLIADEPTTALDVTIQAQILNLLKGIQKELHTSIIFITHDLGVIAELCEDVVVMYGGMIMEKGTVQDIFYNPQHPYTKGLHKSIPKTRTKEKQRLVPIEGSPPDLMNPPKGCPFSSRCPHAMEVCMEKPAPAFIVSETQQSACWLQHEDAPDVKGFTKSGGAK